MQHSSVLTRVGLASAVLLVFVAAGCSGSPSVNTADQVPTVNIDVSAPVVNAPANIPVPTNVKIITNTPVKAVVPVTKPATGSGSIPTTTGTDINGKVGPEPGF